MQCSAVLARSFARTFALAIVFFVLLLLARTGAAKASTDVPLTTYSTNTTWSAANSPYVINGDVTVASGATLTLEPGVVVKFNGTSRSLFINGALNAVGTSSNPVYFTSLKDDSVAGDTHGDGPTVGAAGDWGQIKFANGSSISQLQHVVVRYGGKGFGNSNAEIYVNGSTSGVTLSDAAITDSQTTGIDVYLGSASMTRTTVQRNAKAGVYVDHGHVAVTQSTLTGNTGWGADLLINSAPYPSGSTFYDSTITVNGAGGIRMWGASSTPQGTWPFGNRNRIFDNNASSPSGNQLYNIGLSRDVSVDWSGNYWGPNVHWTDDPSPCGGAGYLALNSGGAPTPLFWWGVFPATDCYVNVPSLAAGPINVQPPFITGFANVGEMLTAAHGDWTNGSPTFAYQWQRCDATGSSCVDLFGQTSPQYQVADADLGSRFRVKVIASNSVGSTTAISDPSLLILSPITDLGERYRPSLLLDSGEHWRPISVAHILSEDQPWQSHYICPNHEDLQFCEVTTGTGSLTTYATSDAYIDFAGQDDVPGSYVASNDPACYSGDIPGDPNQVWECDSGSTSTLYYKYGQSQGGTRYIDYWLFYRYNDVTGLGSVDKHEGDWEGVTVALNPDAEPENPESPPIGAVLFAAHNVVNWVPAANVAYESGQPHHPLVYVARGTHASYPDACSSDCLQPPNTYWPYESPHDGTSQWGNNSITGCECTQAFPEGSDAFTYWPGSWGESQGTSVPGFGTVGHSPRSPGSQSRFTCSADGYDSANCAGPPLARRRESAAGRGAVAPPRACASWMTFEVSVLACDAKILSVSLARHRQNTASPLRLHVSRHRSGGFPGLVQVVGQPLRAGESIRVSGTASRRMSLYVFVRTQDHQYRLTLPFVRLGLRGAKRIEVEVSNDRPFLAYNGRRLPTSLVKLR